MPKSQKPRKRWYHLRAVPRTAKAAHARAELIRRLKQEAGKRKV